MSDNGYALDLVSAVRHVATELDRVAPAALSITDDLAAGYQHSKADLGRIRHHEGSTDDQEATRWLVEKALARIDPAAAIVREDGTARLTVPFGDLRYDGRPLVRIYDGNLRLGDPFNPLATGGDVGIFAENIRRGKHQPGKEDEELRESMAAHGWLPGHQVIIDERGVIISGHRRMAVAKDLGIEPDVLSMHFGDGDGGDIERLNLAFRSNTGGKPFSKTDRQQIAAYLTRRGWTQRSIGEALGVARTTILRDLREVDVKSVQVHVEVEEEGEEEKPKKARKRGKAKKSPDTEQRQVSANVKPEIWAKFKEQAKSDGGSAADKVGELINRTVEESGQPHEHRCGCGATWAD